MPRPLTLLLALGLCAAGCDRAPLEQIGPDLEIVSPDLSRALSAPTLRLELRAVRGSSVESVRVNGIEADRSGDRFFVDLMVADPGLVPLEIVSTGRTGVESRREEAALYLPYAFAGADFLDGVAAVGEHAAARLPDGSILVAGGAPSPDAPATGAAFSVRPGLDPVVQDSLITARAGHTMTPLPDGKLLVVGGSSRTFPSPPSPLDQLVSTAEVFDPATGRFLPVTLDLRDPIARAQHTAAAVPLPDGGAAIYLTGGVGPAGTRAGEPLFGVISTVRRLRYEPGLDGSGGRLVQDPNDPADGPRIGYLVEPAEATVGDVLETTALVGAKDSLNGFVDESFRVRYAEQTRDTRVFELPGAPAEGLVRAGHAGAPGPSGFAVFTGGRAPRDASQTPIAATEIYADGPRRRFALPETGDLQVPRWGHTATSVGDGRILVIGGFSRDGDPVSFVERFGPR